jgi:hypothetical protein
MVTVVVGGYAVAAYSVSAATGVKRGFACAISSGVGEKGVVFTGMSPLPSRTDGCALQGLLPPKMAWAPATRRFWMVAADCAPL